MASSISSLRALINRLRGPHQVATLPAALAACDRRHPRREALVSGPVRLTYHQLQLRTESLAGRLEAAGLVPGDAVAALLPNGPEMVLTFLATAQMGGVFVPVDLFHEEAELARLLGGGRVAALVTCQEFVAVARGATRQLEDLKLLLMEQDQQGRLRLVHDLPDRGPGAGAGAGRKEISPEDPLLHLYTSGTTGEPKRVLLSHARALDVGRAWRRNYSLSADDRCYTLAPLFRSPALLGVVVAGVCHGITMVLPATFEPEGVWDQVLRERITFFHATPYHFAVMVNKTPVIEGPRPRLKACYSTGNRLSPVVARRFVARFGVHIEERYGTSEVGGICADGRPLGGVRLRLLDPRGRRVRGAGEVGEVVVRTPLMARGYHGRPDLSRQVFDGGWFHTGDLGRLDQHGRLQILCRKKSLVQVGRHPVYADEVEQVLLGHPDVRRAMVALSQTDGDEGALEAAVVLKRGRTPGDLMAYCRGQLDPHKVPRRIEAREDLPHSWTTVATGRERDYPRWGEY